MARANPFTLLSLAEFARQMKLDPLHFCQAVSELRPNPHCPDIWFQYDWQDKDKVSREAIGQLIMEAERDIADAIGYWPAPVWVTEEHRDYPRPRQAEWFSIGADARTRLVGMNLHRGYVIEGGQRATTALNSGNEVVWTAVDADGDTFTELAQFQFTVPSTLDPCEVRAYFKEYTAGDAANSRTDPASEGADFAWEVRPLRCTKSDTTLTCYTEVWNLIRPQLQEELAPDQGGLDGDDFGAGAPDLGIYVDALVFYREYNDPESQVEFHWDSDLSCDAGVCVPDTQAGCFSIQKPRTSLVIPRPSTYNSSTGSFTSSSWDNCVAPDAVRFWYRAGWTPESHRTACVELDDYWARIITMLAVARLEWPLCECTNVKQVSDYWRQDAAKMTKERSFNLRAEELSNPFGQRIGEVLAWRRCAARARKRGQAVNV